MKAIIKGILSWYKNEIKTLRERIERNILSDKALKCKVVFGPVRSRKLGMILGINNIKPKVCSYNCIYCPSGNTECCSIDRNYCLSPYELHSSVRNKLEELYKNKKEIEYIAFTGSGVPTLDLSLSKEIFLLREFGYKIAVFTNSSLLWNDNVKENLMFADYVSVKIDTAIEETWLKMNRPHQRLDLDHILEGVRQFSNKFGGTLTTETMLIKNNNDNFKEIEELSKYLNTIKREASYFTIPIYPTAENYAEKPDDETLQQLSCKIKEIISKSVLLCCPETEEFFATDDFESELLGLLSIHPVRFDAVNRFVKNDENLRILKKLLSNNLIKEAAHHGKKFYTIAGVQQTKENIIAN
jgi:wyosine [tRNA(Phe)-imidazoG37] synthetase (radical SAM superfamily)